VISEWQRYGSNDEEFSALLPDRPSASALNRPIKDNEKPKRGRMYASYRDGVAYVILSLDNPGKKDALSVFISEFPRYPVFHDGNTFERDVTLNGFKGKQYRLALNGVNGIVQFYMTGTRVYIFEVVSEDLSQPSVNKFLESLTLDEKSKGKELGGIWQIGGEPANPVPAAPLPDTSATQSIAEKFYKPSEVTRKAVVVTRPEPQYTEEARKNQVTGTVVLRAIFSSSGKVTHIRTVSGLEHGLTERAVAAVRLIKFLPAVKDGNFVSQYIQVEYNFNLY
jgi:TonB family protein